MHGRIRRVAAALAFVLAVFLASGGAARLLATSSSVAPAGFLGQLEGAAVDTRTGELVLFGSSDPALPALDPSDLTVALRTRFDEAAPLEERWPGVTIEFSATSQTALDVFYTGDVRGTHFGYVIFEADRLLKYYGLGNDNSGGAAVPISSSVPGYQSELACLAEEGYAPPAGQQIEWRKWFSPTLVIDVAPDNRSITFVESRMTLNWAYDTALRDARVDECVQRFVDHFNANYQAFADEQLARGNPVLHELVQLGRLVGIAEWLYDRGLAGQVAGLNAPWLKGLPVTAHDTPATTPRIDVGAGNIIQSGGVDMYVGPSALRKAAGTSEQAALALAARPSLDATTWQAEREPGFCIAGGSDLGPVACAKNPDVVAIRGYGRSLGFIVDVRPAPGTAFTQLRLGAGAIPYYAASGDIDVDVDVDLSEPDEPTDPSKPEVPAGMYFEMLGLPQSGPRGHGLPGMRAARGTAANAIITVSLIPAQGDPRLVATFTDEDRLGVLVPGFIDLSPYIGQKVTLRTQIRSAPGGEVLYAIGNFQVTTARPQQVTPSPTPHTPTPVTPTPTRYPVFLPSLSKP